jgi:hypothetical protein
VLAQFISAMNRNRRVVSWLGCLAVLAALEGTLYAGSQARVGILRFAGKGEVDVRVAVTRAVGTRGFALVGAQALDQAEESSGKPLTGRGGVAAAAKALQLAAVIDGRVEVGRGAGTARIAIRDRDGSVVANESWSVRHGGERALARDVARTFWRRLGPALEEASGHRRRAALVVRRGRHRHR